MFIQERKELSDICVYYNDRFDRTPGAVLCIAVSQLHRLTSIRRLCMHPSALLELPPPAPPSQVNIRTIATRDDRVAPRQCRGCRGRQRHGRRRRLMLIPPSPPRDAADDAAAAATTAAMMMMMMIMTMIRLIPLDVRRVESEGPGRGGEARRQPAPMPCSSRSSRC